MATAILNYIAHRKGLGVKDADILALLKNDLSYLGSGIRDHRVSDAGMVFLSEFFPH